MGEALLSRADLYLQVFDNGASIHLAIFANIELEWVNTGHSCFSTKKGTFVRLEILQNYQVMYLRSTYLTTSQFLGTFALFLLVNKQAYFPIVLKETTYTARPWIF